MVVKSDGSRIPIQLTEGDDVLFVTLKSPDVELLTGITPQQLKDSEEFGLQTEEDLKIELEKLTVVCFLRKQTTKDRPGESVQSNAYVAIKTYNAVDVKINAAPEALPMKIDANVDEPPEKQFFSPTASKVLKEIEDEQPIQQLSRPSSSAKRSIAFVSPPTGSEKAIKAAAGKSLVSNVVEETPAHPNSQQGENEGRQGPTGA